MTSPFIGVCKLDPSIDSCLTLTILGKGGHAVAMRPENRLSPYFCFSGPCQKYIHLPKVKLHNNHGNIHVIYGLRILVFTEIRL